LLVNNSRERFIELYNSGANFPTIKKELNLSDTRVYALHRTEKKSIRRPPTEREAIAAARARSAFDLFKAGKSTREVALILGVTSRQAERIKASLGLVVHSAGEKAPDEILNRAALMVEDCWPPSEIAETLNVSRRWVYKKFPNYKYSQTPGAMPNCGRYKYLLEILPDKLERSSIK
jgi:DNA invertase Pin-like site-specific DNA recombinase